MSTARRVAKNSAFIFISEIIIRVVTFSVGLILIRYLGSADFGKYSLIYAFLAFFEVFANMGVDAIVVRELSRDEAKGAQLLSSAITLKFFFSLFGFFLCLAITQLMRYSLDIKLLIYLASLSMPFSFGTLFTNIFQAKLSMKYVTAVMTAMKLILGGFTLLFVHLSAGLFYFILLNLLIYLLQIVLIYSKARRLLHIKINLDFKIWKEILKSSWPIALNIIFVSIYMRIDQIMLFHMKGSNELGFYAAAVKIAELPVMIVGIFMASAGPLLFKYAKTSAESFERTYKISFRYLMIVIIPIAVIATLYSKQIILACYGKDFLPSQFALGILIWATVIIYAGTVHDNILLAANLQHLDPIFTGLSAALNVILNLILIPKYSFVGAAIATLASYSLFIPISYALKPTRKFCRALLRSTLRPSLAAFFAGLAVHVFSPFYFIADIVLSGILYLSLLILIGEINSMDIKYAKEIFFRRIG